MKYFYHKIITVESLIIELDGMGLSESQKLHLGRLIDSTIHHTVMDLILTKLPQDDHGRFVSYLKENPESEIIMEFLTERIDNIEVDIILAVENLKKEMLKDMKEAKTKY